MNIYTLIWFLLGIFFIISELFIPGFTIFFFGCGALLTAITGLIFPAVESNYIIQIIIWLFSSVLSLIFLRKKFSHAFSGKIHHNQTDKFYGKTAIVIDSILPGQRGRITISGTTWNAESLDQSQIDSGEKVIVKRTKESETFTFLVEKKL